MRRDDSGWVGRAGRSATNDLGIIGFVMEGVDW